MAEQRAVEIRIGLAVATAAPERAGEGERRADAC